MTDDKGDRKKRRWLAWLAGGSGGLVVLLAALWTQRAPIAENFIGRELNRLGARARYDLVKVGLRTQRIEHLVLGDPASPDLTADWVEIDIAFAGITPEVAAVRASGVRMRGRLLGGQLTLGELDKFRDTTSEAPFTLPDIKVALTDARMRLDSDYGAIGLSLNGGGNLRSGFEGKLAAVAPRLGISGCTGENVTAFVDIATRDARPHVAGPLRSTQVACPTKAAIADARLAIDLVLGDKLDSWRGNARGGARAAVTQFARLIQPGIMLDFRGDRTRTEGTVGLTSAGLSASQGTARAIALESRFSVAGSAISADGNVRAADMRLANGDPLAGLRTSLSSTPLAQLATKLADAVRAAGRSNRLAADFSVRLAQGKGEVSLASAELASASGARVRLGTGSRLSIGWPGAMPRLDGRLTVEGGGLPRAALALGRAGGGWAGQLFLEDYVAGSSRLVAREIRFTSTAGGATRFAGDVRLDGPLPDGFVRGLELPLNGSMDSQGAIRINPDCAPVAFSELSYSTLKLGATRLNLCPAEGGAVLAWGRSGLAGGAEARDVRLSGTLGSSPLALAAERARFLLSSSSFSATGLEAQIGQPSSPVRLQFASFDGAIGADSIGGALHGGAGRIGSVPLLMSGAEGRWRYVGGKLLVHGSLTVADSAADIRFKPLAAKDFAFGLVDSKISATGTLSEPRTNMSVAAVTIAHELNSGVGNAELRVDGLTFSDALQPTDLTPLTLGVVADVKGAVHGTGHIRWTPDRVSSDGVFSTNGASLAAAFGPVEGLSGEIRFTDLLGLVTPPHQTMTVASINPGVPVTNGIVHYQLLPDQKVQVEDGIWPFAGGRLVLEPTLLDLGAERPRNLTFRVEGLNAAQFLQQFGFENINASGTFDGILPMVFDADGGRIVDGRLSARAGGGNLAYLGQLTQEDLGYWGNYAFQMLKSVDYRTLDIEMNGDLDGEMVTGIAFTGLSQGEGTKSNIIVRQIAKLPIRFNVTIRAPFRQLLFAARSFYDPNLLIEQNLSALIQAQAESEQQATKPIQQQESETRP